MFLELDSINGEKVLVNINQIVTIGKKYDDETKTTIAFNSSGMPYENYITVENSYREVVNAIDSCGKFMHWSN